MDFIGDKIKQNKKNAKLIKNYFERAKEVVSDSPGLVDFAFGA